MKESCGYVSYRNVPSLSNGQSQQQTKCGEGRSGGESLILILHLLRVPSGNDTTTYGAIRFSKFHPLRGDSRLQSFARDRVNVHSIKDTKVTHRLQSSSPLSCQPTLLHAETRCGTKCADSQVSSSAKVLSHLDSPQLALPSPALSVVTAEIRKSHTRNRLGALANVTLAILCTFEVPTGKVSEDLLVGEADASSSRGLVAKG